MSRTDYSRTLRLAASSSGHSADVLRRRVEATTVLVTADPDQPGCRATLLTLIANLRRLPVQLHIDPRGGGVKLDVRMIEDLRAMCDGIDPERPPYIGPTAADIHLHVGTGSTTAAVRAVADGHGTRLRRNAHPFPTIGAAGTGLGAISTAAALTSEAFKTIVGVQEHRRRLNSALDFCPVTLAEPASPAPIPTLSRVALIGAGAIGTAITLILRELGADGEILVVDPQTLDSPNVTTYSLGDRHDAARQLAKVHLVRRELPSLDVHPHIGSAQDLIDAIDAGSAAMPTIVLGAVDSIEARHQIARIHADLTLDGSTGGDTGTMLSLAEAVASGPCLRCYYPSAPPSGPSTEQQLSSATGLSLERIARGNESLTPEEVAALPPDSRQLLIPHIGKPVCGLGGALGLTGSMASYQPSAAFVAQQAAALVIGALIRRSGPGTDPIRDIQYDAMFGPYPHMVQPRVARPGCRCQVDAALISTVRSRRSM